MAGWLEFAWFRIRPPAKHESLETNNLHGPQTCIRPRDAVAGTPPGFSVLAARARAHRDLDLLFRDSGRLVSLPDLIDWQSRNRTLTALAAYTATPILTSGGDAPERPVGSLVSRGFFETPGVRPFWP
jgi:hypothetical protein